MRVLGCLAWVLLAGCGARGALVVPPEVEAGRADAGRADAGRDAGSGMGAFDISVGPIFAALSTPDGRYFEWSVQGDVGEARLHPEVPAALQIEIGRAHRCLLDDEGRVLCWGSSETGALGLGAMTSVAVPTEVPLPAPAVDLSVSTQTTCAVLLTGETHCWGANRYRQLGSGEGDEEPIASPAQVEIEPRAVRVVVSPTHACAQLATRQLLCWGAHRHSQLGDGTHTTSFSTRAVVPLGVRAPGAFAVGLEWSCARTLPGEVLCWGEPASAPRRALFVAEPTRVEGLSGVSSMSLGDNGHACFLSPGARVSCFAYSDAEPRPTTARAAPVPGLADDVIDLDVGYWYACALHADGGVSCWAPNGAAARVVGLP